MATLIQIINKIKEIGTANKMIQTTMFGIPMDAQALQDVKYPLFCFDLVDMPLSDKIETFNFRMMFLDMMKADRSNEEDALSDMIMISNDVVAALNNNNNDFQLNKSIQRERIQDETPDILCGTMLTVSLYQPMDYNRCQIPNY